MTFNHHLLRWYDQHKRDLPWRHNPNPYTILVSEIMLQQTRVEAVIPLYERFITRFPDLESLASASQDEVLSYWQGLGYYSRARRLHETAQILTAEYGGCIPNNKAELLSLPGIGAYTAGALLSIAFFQPVVAVDGNLLRIGARLFLIYEPIDKATARRKIKLNLRSSYRLADLETLTRLSWIRVSHLHSKAASLPRVSVKTTVRLLKKLKPWYYQ